MIPSPSSTWAALSEPRPRSTLTRPVPARNSLGLVVGADVSPRRRARRPGAGGVEGRLPAAMTSRSELQLPDASRGSTFKVSSPGQDLTVRLSRKRHQGKPDWACGHSAERFVEMATTPWYLEIVHVSSHEKQQDLLTLLHDVPSVTALGSSSGPDHYVVFECPDRRLKTSIEELFVEVDPASVLTETHHPMLQPEGGEIA